MAARKLYSPSSRFAVIALLAVLPPSPAARAEAPAAAVSARLGIPISLIEQLHNVLGVTPQRLATLPARSLGKLLRKIKSPPSASARARRLWGKLKRFSPKQWHKALRARQALRAARSQRVAGIPVNARPSAVPRDGSPLSPEKYWVFRGPNNFAGRVRSLVFDPGQPSRMWLGSAGGGVWASTDGGATWKLTDDYMQSMVVSALAVHPKKRGILFAGTGEAFSAKQHGAGLFRSRDGGASWSLVPGTDTDNFRQVNRIAVSADGRIILVATNKGLFRSTDDLETAPRLEIETAGSGDQMYDVKIDTAAKPGVLRAIAATSLARIHRYDEKTNKWVELDRRWPSSLNRRVEIAFAASNVVYASVYYGSGDRGTNEIWRSSDGGKTFKKTKSKVNFGGVQGEYTNALWAGDPDPNVVVVGGIELWRSTDGGNRFDVLSNGTTGKGSPHSDYHVIVSHPTEPERLFVATDGGVFATQSYKTVKLGDAWTPRNGNLETTQFWSVSVTADGDVFGGTQDNGTLMRVSRKNSENAWRSIFGGDGISTAADPKANAVFYGSIQHLGIFRSNASGGYIDGRIGDPTAAGNWNGWKAPPLVLADNVKRQAAFGAPFLLDPSNHDRILAAATRLWRTNNARAPVSPTEGPTWEPIQPSSPDGVTLEAVGVAPINPAVIWTVDSSGQLLTTDQGTGLAAKLQSSDAWNVAQNPCDQGSSAVSRIVFDPNSSDTVYLVCKGDKKDNLYRLRKNASDPVNLHGSLPAVPFYSLAIHPKNSRYLYLGTAVGLFVSQDTGQSWVTVNSGPNSAKITDLAFHGTTLYAATYGRGVWSIDLPTADSDQPIVQRPISASCNKEAETGIVHLWARNVRREPGRYRVICDRDLDTGEVQSRSQLAAAGAAEVGKFRSDGWIFLARLGPTDNTRTVSKCTAKFTGEGVRGESAVTPCVSDHVLTPEINASCNVDVAGGKIYLWGRNPTREPGRYVISCGGTVLGTRDTEPGLSEKDSPKLGVYDADGWVLINVIPLWSVTQCTATFTRLKTKQSFESPSSACVGWPGTGSNVPSSPPAPGGVGARVAAIAGAEVGLVKRTNAEGGCSGEKVGADRLLGYYREGAPYTYNQFPETKVRRACDRAHAEKDGWSGIFAAWAVRRAGRADVFWKDGQLQGLGDGRLDRNVAPGDVIVVPGNRYRVVESVAGDTVTVIAGDRDWINGQTWSDGVTRYTIRRSEIARAWSP